MRILEARATNLRKEMDKGKGGEELSSFPVTLEPPFLPFVYTNHDQAKQGTISTEDPPLRIAVPELSFLSVRPSADDDFSRELAEQLLVAAGPCTPLSFEIIAIAGRSTIQIAGGEPDVVTVSRQVLAHYMRSEVSPANDLLQERREELSCARNYTLRSSPLFLIREVKATEPYTTLLGLLDSLGASEIAVFQVLFMPVRHDWQGNFMETSHSPWEPKKSAFIDIPELPKMAERKVARPLFAVAVRLATSTPELINRIEGSFLSQFNGDENGFYHQGDEYPVNSIIERSTHTHGMILNTTELATLVHLPDPGVVPRMFDTARMTAQPPSMATDSVFIPLGKNRHRGLESPVGISEDWLTRHVAIFGGTGYGKTNLLKLFVKPVESGCGLAFIDPAGDAAREFLDLVPHHRAQDVVYFNPADREYPPALNVLVSSDREREMLTSELMVALKRLFRGAAEFGPRMEWILRQAVRTLLTSEGEKTLRDIPWLLSDESFREHVLRTVNDPDLNWFWKSRNFPSSVIDPILNRLSGFLDRPTIRNIVSQPNLIDFHKILRERKILICNLGKGLLGEDAASLLGSFILSKLQLAAMARAELSPEERTVFPIIVDEFQNYASHNSDTAGIRSFLTEARKFGVSLITATQFLSQLDREVTNAIFGNAGTIICLRLGLVDAHFLERELGDFEMKDILNLTTGKALVRMGSAESAFNIDIPKVIEPAQSYREQIVNNSRQLYCRAREDVELAIKEGGTHDKRPGESLTLNQDEMSFLDYVALHADETVTEVAKVLRFSGYKAARIRNLLSERGFLIEVETRLGQGGTLAKYAIPTLPGFRILGKEPYQGRGGPIHRHFQKVISDRARGHGYIVHTEHAIVGGSVDIHLEKEGVTTAVELSVTSNADRELDNIRKCLDVDYHRVVVLFLDNKERDKAEMLAKISLSEREMKKITFGRLDKFNEII